MKQRTFQVPSLASAGPENPEVRALCRSVQETIASWLLKPIQGFAETTGARSLILSGGVASNSTLREETRALGARLGLALALPPPRLCTDNGAMVAAAGALLPPSLEPLSLNAEADLRLP